MLQHCFPPNLRQFLNELPETLDETYERILRGINKAQQGDARRLLQCLAVAVRPLRVEELAELLAFDFQASSEGGIPKLKEDWRWDNHEEAVLSTCSSLVVIVTSSSSDSKFVQFSHFSVKEYLTSPRLARSHRDISRFHIDPDPAHTIMAQACLGTLLRLDEQREPRFPLAEYAAQHWVDHARFGEVSSRIQDGMDDLFDTSKPHFAAWLRVFDIDERWHDFSPLMRHQGGSPLYYASFCGFYNLADRLIMKHPEQVNTAGGHILAPLQAALYNRHFRVANLLLKHGAVVDIRGDDEWTPLHAASWRCDIDVMRWLLDHGADANARTENRWTQGWTPLHLAAYHPSLHPEAVQLLLEHNAHVNSQDSTGMTPLYATLCSGKNLEEKEAIDFSRLLLEHGADTNIYNITRSSPLHQASSRGWLEAARLLLSYGAKVDEKNDEGLTPFHVASSQGYHEITKLLLEHGAVPE